MKIFIVILYVIIFLFQKLKMFNIINVNNNKCKCNNFYSLELFNNLDFNCIYNYDNIDPNFIFDLYQNKTKNFISNYKDSNFEEINKFLLYYHNTFKNYSSMPLINAPFNNFNVTKKMLIEPISIEEAINNDYYDNLTQKEKNLLVERYKFF